MAQRIANHVFSKTPFKPYIFRVDDLLRRVNVNAYEPAMVAIGPYHHGKENMERMEHKLKYLQQLLKRRNESSADRYVTKLRALEEEARSCYAEPISLNKDEFVQTMLVDGCFIIELLRKTKMKELVDEDDRIFRIDRIKNILRRDLILFENQLPLFILVQLFNMTKLSDDQDDMNIAEMALKFFGGKLPCSKGIQAASTRVSLDNVDHLLGLLHHNWSPSFAEMLLNRNVGTQAKLQLIKSTTELERVGINFKKAVECTSLFDIRFEKRVMKIPAITVDGETECLFRNLIAYEQYHQNFFQNYVTGYATFMNCLIDTAKDAEALRSYGIIENRLADDASVSTMFNKLCSNMINPGKFCYSHVFEKVNDHRPGFFRKKFAELKYCLRDPLTFLNVQFSLVTFVLATIQIMDFVKKS